MDIRRPDVINTFRFTLLHWVQLLVENEKQNTVQNANRIVQNTSIDFAEM